MRSRREEKAMDNGGMRRADVAAAITRGMRRLGISQAQLAMRAGVTQSYISQICKGRKAPTLETLRRICGVLGISLGELGDAPEEGETSPGNGRRLTQEERYLVECYRAMNQQNRNVLFGLVNLLDKDVRRDGAQSTGQQPPLIEEKG